MYNLILRDDDLESPYTRHIPEHQGTGFIKGLILEEGLYLRHTRWCFKEDTEIIRLAGQPGSDLIFTVCYLLTPGSLKLVRPQTLSVLPCSAQGNIFLTSNTIRLALQIPEGVLSHTVEILFTKEWLQMHLAGMEEKVKKLSESLVAEEYSSILTSKTLPADELMIGELEQELDQPGEQLLTIRARVLLLLSNAISRWPGHATSRTPLKKNWHVQTIRQVEQRLVQSLEDMLPPQRQLAKEFALSESTLKRHFKAVYGKTMYDYYLEKKMDLAKALLQEKKISVSETAYKLGYEKVSAFISMFKKYHNILPGSLK